MEYPPLNRFPRGEPGPALPSKDEGFNANAERERAVALRIYNTRTRRKAAFRASGDVRMYVCGPTVYASGHMGHGRSYVAFDVIRRYLEFLGHRVRYVVNITDVEDSITKRARQARVRPLALAARYEREFLEDMAALGVKPADANPRVSEHIKDIVAVAKDLVASGKAYVANRSVYLDTGDGGAFGSLSHTHPREAVVGRAAGGPGEAPVGFRVLKARKLGGLAWGSPWGPGTPGWHVE